MTDTLSAERRSWNMSRIGSRNTAPEIRMRSLLHRAGFRFRLHAPGLPGKPDIVLRRYKAVVFVHGCFWHRHGGCRKATTPSTRPDFWQSKFNATIERDRRKTSELNAMGWRVLTVWECELEKNPDQVIETVRNQLHGEE